ncbi:ATP-binding protein [Streptomyces antibioticus]|uniref:ATP-binding protein n=1 Tax=Streptomyces antibioticus TaxID=1890 RepID=UPI0036D88C62
MKASGVTGGGGGAARRTSLGFTGRTKELDATVEALRHGPSVVLIEGAAGVGKSRLLDEAAASVDDTGLQILRGWCHPLREPLPFGPAIDALRQARPPEDRAATLSPATALLAAQVPELAEWLPEPGDESPDHARARLTHAIHGVLAALGPVLLAIEDVHWADEATRELLLLLARNTPAGLRLVLTYRRHDLPAHGNVLGAPYRRPIGTHGLDLTLRPLDRSQVTELATHVIGARHAEALAPQLFERSGGLPLVVEEDLRVVADRLTRTHGAEPLAVLEDADVPRALQEAIGSRVATLPPPGVALVQGAAVLAVPAGEDLLAELAGLEEGQAEEALEAALDASVLEESGPDRYAFHHTLARQAVYERISGPRRRRLHRRAIQALQAQNPPPLVQIAYHARQLGDPALWLPHTERAARHAVEVGDDGTAADQLRQLLHESTLPTESRTWAAVELSRIAARSADPAATIERLARIVADPALPRAVRGEIRLNLGRALINNHSPDFAEQLSRAVDELEDDQPEKAAIALASLGVGSWLGRTREQDVADMERAVHLLSRADDPVARATVSASRITLLGILGDPDGDRLLDELLDQDTGDDLEVLRQHCRALHNAAYDAFLRGRDDKAAGWLDKTEALAEHIGDHQATRHCGMLRLRIEIAQGRRNSLTDDIDSLLQRSSNAAFQTDLMLVQAKLDTARGRWSDARRHALACTTDPQEAGDYFEGTADVARVDLAKGDPEAGWRVLQPALDALRHRNVWVRQSGLVPVAVQAGLATGHRAEAEELVERASAGAAGCDAPAAQAEILLCRGLLAADSDPRAAADLLERARLDFAAIPRPYQAAQAVEHAGRVLLATEPAVAARYVKEALDAFTGLEAVADAARCQRTLREAGRHRPTLRSRHSYGTDLSPREQQVADLLATGATNKDIAQALALSVRTAEHHVASVLKKLGTTRDAITTST